MNRRAYQLGRAQALASFKLAEWNWELTGRKVPKDEISSDNGRRAYGVNFSEPERPNRSVSRAFDNLRVQKPSDFINEDNAALFTPMGAP